MLQLVPIVSWIVPQKATYNPNPYKQATLRGGDAGGASAQQAVAHAEWAERAAQHPQLPKPTNSTRVQMEMGEMS